MNFLYSPRGIASYPGGGFARIHTDASVVEVVTWSKTKNKFVTNQRFEARYKVKNGENTQTIQKPWDVAVSADKEFYVTNGTPFVQVYDKDGSYKRRFAAIPPDRGASNELKDPVSALHGITFNNRGQIMVGDTNYKYISVLTTEGEFVDTFSVGIAPMFIAATPLDQVYVSSCECIPVEVVDVDTGTCVKSITAPKDVGQWCPTGVCCSSGEEEIYIANQMGKVGIYSFTLEGDFLECFEEKVNSPWGLAVSEDENYLFVSNSNSSGQCIFETDKGEDMRRAREMPEETDSEYSDDSGEETAL